MQWYQELCQFKRQSAESRKSTESTEPQTDRGNEKRSESEEKEASEAEAESKAPKIQESFRRNDSPQIFVSAEYLQAKLKEREERRKQMEGSATTESSAEPAESATQPRERGPSDSLSSSNSCCATPPIPPRPPKRDHQKNKTRVELCNY